MGESGRGIGDTHDFKQHGESGTILSKEIGDTHDFMRDGLKDVLLGPARLDETLRQPGADRDGM